MPESKLAITLSDLSQAVGIFLGYGGGTDAGQPAWNSAQSKLIETCIKSGLRQFYWPPPINDVQYNWSFLRPTSTIFIPQGSRSIYLPDDFGGVEGLPTANPTSSTTQSSWPINVVGEQVVREKYTRYPSATGRPELVAVEPLAGTSGYEGQRFRLAIYPEPDQDYNLTLTYYVNPDYLTGSKPYAMGGPQHAETILESCLAIAEQRLDDRSGVHTAQFLVRLAASIQADRKLKPALIGYNGDRSDGDYPDPRYSNRLGSRVNYIL